MSQPTDVRTQWCWTQQPGAPAVFQQGQEMRCPGKRRCPDGSPGTCGASLHIWAGSRMVVRPRTSGSARISGASAFHCRSCHIGIH